MKNEQTVQVGVSPYFEMVKGEERNPFAYKLRIFVKLKADVLLNSSQSACCCDRSTCYCALMDARIVSPQGTSWSIRDVRDKGPVLDGLLINAEKEKSISLIIESDSIPRIDAGTILSLTFSVHDVALRTLPVSFRFDGRDWTLSDMDVDCLKGADAKPERRI